MMKDKTIRPGDLVRLGEPHNYPAVVWRTSVRDAGLEMNSYDSGYFSTKDIGIVISVIDISMHPDVIGTRIDHEVFLVTSRCTTGWMMASELRVIGDEG